ncbi:Glutathione transferase FosA [compost metagenome]
MSTHSAIQGLDFLMIPTQDLNRAVSFYRDLLGLELDSMWGEMGAEFKLGNEITLAVMDPSATGRPFAPHGTGAVALKVKDVDATVQMLQAKGIVFHGERIDSGVCKMAFFSDPDGNSLMLHHRYAP